MTKFNTSINISAAISGPTGKSEQKDRDEWAVLANGVVKPGRRTNKFKSGKSGRVAHHSATTVRKVGGYANTIQAIYAPADTEMCVVVDPTKDRPERYTRNVGGSTPSPYRGGKGA